MKSAEASLPAILGTQFRPPPDMVTFELRSYGTRGYESIATKCSIPGLSAQTVRSWERFFFYGQRHIRLPETRALRLHRRSETGLSAIAFCKDRGRMQGLRNPARPETAQNCMAKPRAITGKARQASKPPLACHQPELTEHCGSDHPAPASGKRTLRKVDRDRRYAS